MKEGEQKNLTKEEKEKIRKKEIKQNTDELSQKLAALIKERVDRNSELAS